MILTADVYTSGAACLAKLSIGENSNSATALAIATLLTFALELFGFNILVTPLFTSELSPSSRTLSTITLSL